MEETITGGGQERKSKADLANDFRSDMAPAHPGDLSIETAGAAGLDDSEVELILPQLPASSTAAARNVPAALRTEARGGEGAAGNGSALLVQGDKGSHPPLSPIVLSGGTNAARRFLEFFTVTIRNPHTRRAYYRAVSALLDFCEARGVTDLTHIQPMMVAAYIETRTGEATAPTVKQELAAIRQMFDYLVTGHVVDTNPAAAVRGPRYSIQKGKTPVLAREEARNLLLSIPVVKPVKVPRRSARNSASDSASNSAPIYKEGNADFEADFEVSGETMKGGSDAAATTETSANPVEVPCLVGLRDRALIGLMVYSFARVGAVTKLKVGDYYQNGKRFFVGLHEKGGKYHELPVHHRAEEYIDAYLAAAGITAADKEQRKTPLFRTSRGWSGELSDKGMTPSDVLYMVKRRAEAANLSPAICCHTFRATGITAYLENGGTVENAQNIANHADPRTTRLYDRRSDKISLTEIERIQL